MSETVFVSEISYRKGEAAFEELSRSTEFRFIPVDEKEESLARRVREEGIRAFVADIHPYRGALYDALPRDGVIARFGVGHDSVDKEKASKKGIWVTNTPGVLDNAVAEHAVWLLGSLARLIPSLHASTRVGQWKPCSGVEVAGRTLAIIGLGRIGQMLCRKAALGLGMRVIGWSRDSPAKFAARLDHSFEEFQSNIGLTEYTDDLEYALGQADFVSLHVASVPATRHLADAGFFAAMKPGSCIINTARGAVLDEIALYEAIASEHIGGAALDVFEQEPYSPADSNKDLRKLANCIMTPHVGSNTKESNQAMALAAGRAVIQVLTQDPHAMKNIVNPSQLNA
jgi:lactate dehydrogenase-like 2-hydroxyacid dehydrogenase